MTSAFFAARMGTFYGAIFLFIGMFMPYFPLWLKIVGLSETQVAIILAAPMIVRIFMTPLVSAVADSFRNWRTVLIFLCWLSLFVMMVLAVAGQVLGNFVWILFLSVLFGVAWSSVMPLSETVAMRAVRKTGLSYGRARLWGSATFIVASMGLGWWIDLYGTGVIMPAMIAALFLSVLSAHWLPQDHLSDMGW